MGLAASQARALLLVARKSDLEYRSQCLTQRKMVLSQQTEQLAKEYSSKISNRKLRFVYNLKGDETKVQYEDLTYYSLDAGNTNFVGTYRVLDGQGNIVVASIDDIPKKKVKVPVYIQVTTNDEGKQVPVEIKKPVYSNTTNDEIGKNHSNNDKPEYNTVYVDSYNTTTGQVEKIAITDGNGNIDPRATVTTKDGHSYPIYTLREGVTAAEDGTIAANLDNYELTQYGQNAGKYTLSYTPSYVYSTEDKSGDSNYGFYSYQYVETAREPGADSYYTGDDGRRYVVCKDIAKTNYFQNGLRNGAFVLQQETSVNETDDLGNKIGEVSSWNTVPWQGIDVVQDVLYTEDDAMAQSEYEAKTACIKAQDQMLDLEIKQIETQHKAIEAEQDSVKKIIEGNIDKTFKIFA